MTSEFANSLLFHFDIVKELLRINKINVFKLLY